MKKILVIENDPDTLEILAYLFKESAFEVFKYLARIPVDKITDDDPDLIVLDYYLDEGYGSEICIELKANPATKHIPVILVSTSDNLHQIAADSSADAYLQKPFNLTDLDKLINKLVA